MKALILIAGLGTRLRPITFRVPKSIVPINNIPLLKYHLDTLTYYGILDVLINIHYLPNAIYSFIDGYKKINKRIRIKSVFEETLLGSAGTLKKNKSFFRSDTDFLVIYGDNLTNINYLSFWKYHKQKGGIATIASYYENHPESKGIIVFNKKKVIQSFVEKPKPEQITSHHANAGIYMLNKKIFNYLDKYNSYPIDFGRDLFPNLLSIKEYMYIYIMKELLLDIGTHQTYQLAQKIVGSYRFKLLK